MKIELQKFNRKFVLVVVVFKRQLISKTSQKDVGDAGTTKICKIPCSSKIFACFDWFYSEKKLGFSNETNWWIHKKAFN